MQFWGTDHAGFVDDDEAASVQCQCTGEQVAQCLRDGVAGVAGALAHSDVDSLAGRCE